MQDRPTLKELLEAVRGFIDGEVVPSIKDQRLRFRARVAANVLAVAARERELGDAHLRAEADRLRRLLGDASAPPPAAQDALEAPLLESSVERWNAELARRIRSGEIDAAPGGEVWAHLRRTAVEKLLVANPELLARS